MAADATRGVLYDARNLPEIVELAAAQIADDKKNIFHLLFALGEWCTSLELGKSDGRKIALFCLVGDRRQNGDAEPLEQFRRREYLPRPVSR